MKIKKKELLKSLNKTFRKEQINRTDFDNFKSELKKLLSKVDEDESEEHLKYPLRDFLLNTSFSQNEINTKGRTDLAIYSGNTNKTPVNVIFETKKPKSNDFPTITNINCKATHEAVLYYIRERYEEKNDEIKHIIITNIYEWFIFDAHDFEKYFYNNKGACSLVVEYEKWKTGQKTSKNTDHFYKIVKHYIDKSENEISLSYFDIRGYEKKLNDDEKIAVPLFKILSATHLLKLSYITDSNSLNSQFYNELLYIIGLTEVKEGSKKIIKRPIDNDRISGSIIENAISTIKTENRLSKIKDIYKFGETEEEQLLNIALELTITWINRILFLKLLEAQLISFHKNEKEYKFLDISTITNFDELNELFFDILAKETHEREDFIKKELKNIPYLNSSLFEISKLEDNSVRINSLKNRLTMPVYSHSVLTDKKKANIPTLEYLFEFLNAYNFTNEGADEIQEENKSLINASVLGLIFEKINGYKEGSFFTPGYITMYMSRETIRRSVIQKFKEADYQLSKNLELSESFNELKTKIENRHEANQIINSIKIIDPAVGSGHFLVSALNEIIAIKSELNILSYKSGGRILDFKAEVVNDDLIITNHENEEIFEYTLNQKGNIIPYKQDLQEAIFNEKQTIIENCLFGVDINPNSVNICRLRLWIELLKHTHYTNESNYSELETLPNIDINIKQGNSLISNFGINGNGLANGQSQKIKLATQKYKDQVILYKSTDNKKVKKDAEKKIVEIKDMFSNVVRPLDKDYKLLKEKEAILGEMPMLFTQEDKENWEKQRAKLHSEIEELKKNLEHKRKTIYQNAFEWRFEFPEVLDENGNFTGFDILIGNPPYGVVDKYLKTDLYLLFTKLSATLVKQDKNICLIVPTSWQTSIRYKEFRKNLFDVNTPTNIVNLPFNVFKEAYVDTCIIQILNTKSNQNDCINIINFDKKDKIRKVNDYYLKTKQIIPIRDISLQNYTIYTNQFLYNLLKRFNNEKFYNLGEVTKSTIGVLASKYDIRNKKFKNSLAFFTGNINRYVFNIDKKKYIDISKHKNSYKDYYFGSSKIWIRRIINRQNRIMCTIPENEFVVKKDIYTFSVTNQTVNQKFLLGILNSKLISYLYLNSSMIATKNDFRQSTLTGLRKLPIVKTTASKQLELSILIDKMLDIKKNTSHANTTKLENQLDKIVYKLYGLSKSEITEIEKFYE